MLLLEANGETSRNTWASYQIEEVKMEKGEGAWKGGVVKLKNEK